MGLTEQHMTPPASPQHDWRHHANVISRGAKGWDVYPHTPKDSPRGIDYFVSEQELQMENTKLRVSLAEAKTQIQMLRNELKTSQLVPHNIYETTRDGDVTIKRRTRSRRKRALQMPTAGDAVFKDPHWRPKRPTFLHLPTLGREVV